jgi:hypothetical protein
MKRRDEGKYRGTKEGWGKDEGFEQLQAESLRRMDEEEENAAYLRSMYEYEDDYDDQYVLLSLLF